MLYLSIACFAFLGGISRYLISILLNQQQFPIATIFVNLIGCFAIAFFTYYLNSQNIPQWFQKGLLTGFLGAFTTLSSFNLDTFHLWLINPYQAIIYVSITVIGGFLMVFLGLTFSSFIFKGESK